MADVISSPLSVIFHKSLGEGRLPTPWKIENITPIHKKGSRSSAGNYRPVSLTSVIGKFIELIICDHLIHHMLMRSWISISTFHLLLTSPVGCCGSSRRHYHVQMKTLCQGCTRHLSDTGLAGFWQDSKKHVFYRPIRNTFLSSKLS